MVEPETKDTEESPKPQASSTRLRWWIDTILESAFLLGIVIIAEMTLADGRVGTFNAHPHPYWAVVLPMAAARGLGAALVAATGSMLLYLVGANRELDPEGMHELLTLDVMLEPILFYAVGFMVGDFRDVNADRIKKLTRKLRSSDTEGDRIREQRDVLKSANRVLETRLVDQSLHFGNLILTASRSERASRREVFEIALELVEEHCGAVASVLLPMEDGSLHLLANRGWPEGESTERLTIARESEIVKRAVGTGTHVNAFALDEIPPEVGPMVVSPLKGGSGVIEALLCLDEIPTSLLNASSIRTFTSIAEWTSAALGRLDREPKGAATDGTSELEPAKNWLGTSEDLGQRLLLEYERSSRYGLPLSLLTIQFTGWKDATRPGMRMVDLFVLRYFTMRLRCSDAIYRFPHPGTYVVILPGTPEAGAKVVRERLLRRIKDGKTALGPVRIEVTGPKPDSPDVDSILDTVVETFREHGSLPIAKSNPLALASTRSVGALPECVRALSGEAGLAMRNEYPLQIVAISARDDPDVNPGLLAFHCELVMDRILRRVDTAFSIGSSHVVLILPNTRAEQAEGVATRFIERVKEMESEAPYGDISFEVLTFGPKYPYYGAFLQAMAAVRPLREVAVAGGKA